MKLISKCVSYECKLWSAVIQVHQDENERVQCTFNVYRLGSTHFAFTLLLSRLQVIEDMILYYTYWSCRLGHGFSVLLFSVDLIYHEWAICRERCCHWQHLIHFVIQLLLGLAFQPFVAFLNRP